MLKSPNRHLTVGHLASDRCFLFTTARENVCAHIDQYLNIFRIVLVWVVPRAKEFQAITICCTLDLIANPVHLFWVRWIVSIRVAERHTHVTRTPLNERQSRYATNSIGISGGFLILKFESKKQFAFRIEWPRVGDLCVSLRCYTPDCSRLTLSASSTLTFAKTFSSFFMERVATFFDKCPNCVCLSGVSMENSVNSS